MAGKVKFGKELRMMVGLPIVTISKLQSTKLLNHIHDCTIHSNIINLRPIITKFNFYLHSNPPLSRVTVSHTSLVCIISLLMSVFVGECVGDGESRARERERESIESNIEDAGLKILTRARLTS